METLFFFAIRFPSQGHLATSLMSIVFFYSSNFAAKVKRVEVLNNQKSVIDIDVKILLNRRQ